MLSHFLGKLRFALIINMPALPFNLSIFPLFIFTPPRPPKNWEDGHTVHSTCISWSTDSSQSSLNKTGGGGTFTGMNSHAGIFIPLDDLRQRGKVQLTWGGGTRFHKHPAAAHPCGKGDQSKH